MITPGFWRGRRVFLTGHTGFKGAWTCLLLRRLGAEVYGYALPPEHERCLFLSASVASDIHHRVADVRDRDALQRAIGQAKPDIVIHMAAQPLVRLSYAEPVETYATNVMGTVHLLDAVRHTSGISAALIVTTDKCYENTGQRAGYREDDRLGGADPYSNSKGCAELVTDAYRRSFFHTSGSTRIASGRAGNVFGGGDWSRDRLVPDAISAFLDGRPLRIRNPDAIRPWQHVLDPIMGYLTLIEKLVDDGTAAEGWNFGPDAESEVPVRNIVERLITLWGEGARWEQEVGNQPYEAAYLRLDCAKAQARLRWRPQLDLARGLTMTVDWYRGLQQGKDIRRLSLAQVDDVLDSVAAAG